jgi:hypothetical protein
MRFEVKKAGVVARWPKFPGFPSKMTPCGAKKIHVEEAQNNKALIVKWMW